MTGATMAIIIRRLIERIIDRIMGYPRWRSQAVGAAMHFAYQSLDENKRFAKPGSIMVCDSGIGKEFVWGDETCIGRKRIARISLIIKRPGTGMSCTTDPSYIPGDIPIAASAFNVCVEWAGEGKPGTFEGWRLRGICEWEEAAMVTRRTPK